MKEFGISVSDKESGDKVEVYFVPMSYSDWTNYTGSIDSYDNASIRYLFKKYIKSAFLVSKESNTSKDIAHKELCSLSPNVIKQIVDKMMEKAGFNSIDSFVETLARLERNASTLPGAYDLFIYLNSTPEIYLSLQEKNVFERASFIATLEKISGIAVKDRFELSLKTGADLDLITPPSAYRPKLKGKAATSLRDRLTGTDLNEDQIGALEDSRHSLQEELRRGKATGPKKFFNWNDDNGELDTFNTESGIELDR